MARSPHTDTQPESPSPRSGRVGSEPSPGEHRLDPVARDEEGRGRDATRRSAIPWKRNLYALWIAQTLAIVGFSLRVPFLPFYLKDLGTVSTEQQALWAGVINAGGAGVMAISAPLWGVVSDRYGRKPMVLRSMFAAMVTVGLMGLATQAWHLLALRFIEGAMTGTVTASTALVAAGTPKARLGFALGMIQTAVFSGASLGPLFGGVLADQIGYRPTFGVAGAMLGAAGLLVLFLVHEEFTPSSRSAAGGGVRGSLGLALEPAMLPMIATMLIIRLASMATQPVLPLYVQQLASGASAPASSNASLAGLTLGVLGLTSAISSVILGRMGDRIGHGRILRWCALGAGLLYLPMAAAQEPWHLVALQALFGVTAGGIIPSANALVADVTRPEQRGVVYGLMAGAASLGGFFGPLIGSGLAATLGFSATFLATGGILLLLAAGIALGGPRARPTADANLASGVGSGP